MAMDHLETIKVDILFDYVKKFQLDIDLEFYEKICQELIEKANYNDATIIIDKMGLQDKFDLQMIVNKLID
jgi:hypothetical protein